MRHLAKVCIILLVCISSSAQAKNQCTDKNLAVDDSEWKDFSGFAWTLPLLSFSNVHGKYETGAVSDFIADSKSNLQIKFRFDLPEDTVANAYNIYRLELDVGEGADAFHYEAGDCDGSIGSFWPLEPAYVGPIIIHPHGDGSPRGIEPMHVKIWGHQ